jgi:prepilin-type processing-associated H-X9-DG protein
MPPQPPPVSFVATYQVAWHGISAGASTLKLAAQGPDTFTYSSNIQAHGLFRLVFPDALIQSSTFTFADGHVSPLHYQESGQARDHSDDVELSFDRNSGRVHGSSQTHAVDQPLDAGIQDPMSVQIELMQQLQAGLAPTRFKLFDKDQAKEYTYTRERTEVLTTPLGALDTVVYRSDRAGSDRVTRLWLAPKLNYLPLQAARSRNGSVDLSMRITGVQQPAP